MQINIIFLMTCFSLCLCGGCGKKGLPEHPAGSVSYVYPPLDEDCCEGEEHSSLPCLVSEGHLPHKTDSIPTKKCH